MVILNCSVPPRARISSTARTPAMPLPTTTRAKRAGVVMNISSMRLDFDEPEIDEDRAAQSVRGGDEQLEDGVGDQVFDDSKWHMHTVFGAHREVPHRGAIAHHDDGDQFGRAVAAAEVDRLGDRP